MTGSWLAVPRSAARLWRAKGTALVLGFLALAALIFAIVLLRLSDIAHEQHVGDLLLLQSSSVSGPQLAAPLPGIHGTDDRVMSGSDAPPWSAIGRVNRRGGGFCTGALIGSRVVLTAAHCLWNQRTGRWLPPAALHFVAGYSRGAYMGDASVESYTLPDNVKVDAQARLTPRTADWAMLWLDRDLGRVAGILPLATLDEVGLAPESASRAVLVEAGYNQDKPHVLSRHDACPLVGMRADGAILLHECDATRGASGAPLLVRRGDGYVLVAVHVGSVTQAERTLGVAVVPPIARLRQARRFLEGD